MALERTALALLTPLLLAAPPPPAAADPALAPARLRPGQAVEILADIEPATPGSDWLALQLSRVNVNGRYGLVYSRDFHVGERGLELRLRGPALGHKRHVGLSFEARF